MSMKTEISSCQFEEGFTLGLEQGLGLGLAVFYPLCKDPLSHEPLIKAMQRVHEIGLPYLLAIAQVKTQHLVEERVYDGIFFSKIKNSVDPRIKGTVKTVSWYLVERWKDPQTDQYKINTFFFGDILPENTCDFLSIEKITKALETPEDLTASIEAGIEILSFPQKSGLRKSALERLSLSFYKHYFIVNMKLATNNNLEAMRQLSECYRFGIGCQQNPQKAIQWRRKFEARSQLAVLSHPLPSVQRQAREKRSNTSTTLNELTETSPVVEAGKSSPKHKTRKLTTAITPTMIAPLTPTLSPQLPFCVGTTNMPLPLFPHGYSSGDPNSYPNFN